MAAGDVLNDGASRVVEQRKQSLQWLNANYYDEFIEVFRASKCRTQPIMVKNAAGKMVEDITRTNVAMPDMAVMIRRGTARLTASPPQLNYTCQNTQLAEKLTAWSYMQYDKTGEGKVQRLHVQQAKTFGFSVTKMFWNNITVDQKRRYLRRSLTDRAKLMDLQGSPQDEIDAAVKQLGPQVQDHEISRAIAEHGDELKASIALKRYEGPAVKFVFIGDFFPEPGFKSVDENCGYMVEQYYETETWLKYWLAQEYDDPENPGKKIPCFDEDECKKLMDDAADYSKSLGVESVGLQTLRGQFWSAVGQTDPTIYRDGKLVKNKRFLVYEAHEMRDGVMWITWVANEVYKIGEMPYPWDLRGKSSYSQLVMLPDLVFGIGDSTTRLGRFLYRLHNVSVGQRTDLVSQILRRTVFVRNGADLPEPIERANMRVIQMKDINDFKFAQETEVPASAWETENQILKQLATLDPSMTNLDTGTNLNPGAGRTATAATLQSRSNDTMLQYELDGIQEYLRETGEKKLWMLQQALQDKIQVPNKYVQNNTALSMQSGSAVEIRTDSNPAPEEVQLAQQLGVEIDPYEIQDDIEVEPEVGSTLSQDDEFRRQNAQNAYQIAQGDPVVWNVREAAIMYAKTLKGADAAKLINPPAPPSPPEPKSSISMTMKFDDMPADVKVQILQSLGIKADIQEFQADDTMKGIIQSGQAADAAGKLAEPASPHLLPPPPVGAPANA